MTTTAPPLPKYELIGCMDGCGRAIQRKEVTKENWLMTRKFWICPGCQRQREEDERFRQAIGRAYGNPCD